MADTGSPWNSLETTKVLISMVTPILIVLIGYWLNKTLHRFEQLQWANRKVIEQRLKLYEDLAPMLNDLLCFYQFIGHWKELTPPHIVDIKRLLDKQVHIHRALFSKEFYEKYRHFMDLCFEQYAEAGRDAKLKTTYEPREQYLQNWDNSWNQLFAEKKAEELELEEAYDALTTQLSKELGIYE